MRIVFIFTIQLPASPHDFIHYERPLPLSVCRVDRSHLFLRDCPLTCVDKIQKKKLLSPRYAILNSLRLLGTAFQKSPVRLHSLLSSAIIAQHPYALRARNNSFKIIEITAGRSRDVKFDFIDRRKCPAIYYENQLFLPNSCNSGGRLVCSKCVRYVF